MAGAKYDDMDASLMARLEEPEAENRHLKKMYAEERLKAEIVQGALQKNDKVISLMQGGANCSQRYLASNFPSLHLS